MEFLELKEIFFEGFGKYVVKICILRKILFIFHKLAHCCILNVLNFSVKIIYVWILNNLNTIIKLNSKYLVFYILSYCYYY